MTIQHGFELVKDVFITELNTQATLYRHQRTGAELLSLVNDDENKAFGITFKTPPEDSTGLPHIMEHSVLCGSRKYPVKEPFVELLKGSLNTFINAVTFSDFTTYPVASTNTQDFYNLVDVYLDAVFYPRISEKTLQQEGWHYELDSPDGELTFKGVVFNEMKGAYSSPDNVLDRLTEQYLLPDTPYGVDSGGDPAVIPDLTYAQFKRFHDTFYHPSNARIFFYGDDDPETRLKLIDEFIADFDRRDVEAAVPLQPRFSEPRTAMVGYDAGEEDGNNKKSMVTVSWLLDESQDLETRMALAILDHILIETPASPLRKALIDSGLGEDLTGGGLSAYQREMYFSTGLKGITSEDAGAVEHLILQTLGDLAEEGIEPDMIEAAMNTAEFRLRENNTGGFPRGLAHMIKAVPAWLHGGDPIESISFEHALQDLKAKIHNGGGRYFEDLIGQYFLNNTHRSTVILEPDAAAREKREAAERDRLAQVRATLSDQDVQAVIADAEELRRLQETPDTPEALATIPRLALDDLDKETKTVPLDRIEMQGSQVFYHDLFTNGVAYLDLGFDLKTLPERYLPYVRLFGRALLEMGTESEDFVKLSQRIGRKTGGIGTSPFTSPIKGSGESTAWLMMRSKGMADQTADLLDVLRDILLTVKLDNQGRFRQMVQEEKAGKEASLVPGGHIVALTRLRAQFNEANWANEQMGGVSYLFFLRELIEKVDSDWPAVLADLEAIRAALINRSSMVCNVTLDAENWGVLQPQLQDFISALPAADPQTIPWTGTAGPKFEGLTIPAQVNYVGKGANLFDLGYTLDGSIIVINNYLQTTWLWERVRVQGGAYGGFSTFDHTSGVWAYQSYRDPNLLNTLDNYDNTVTFLRDLALSEDELTKSIIGAISNIDGYQLPDAKGFSSFVRYLIGYTDAMRQEMRDQVLSTTSADFKQFADVLAQVNETGAVVVVGSPEAISEANAVRGGDWLQVQKLL